MSELYALNYLVGCDLTRNDFETKEDEILNDERKALILSNRQLMFEELSMLTWLKINDCNISEIPEDVKACTQLQRLSAKENAITFLPNPDNLKALESLNLRKNKLNNSTAAMYFENLKELNFGCNEFRNFPLDLSNQKLLRVLSVANNQIPAIPPDFFNSMDELRYLDLSNNEITTIPTSIRRLEHKLFHLSLANNPLHEDKLRSVLTGLSNLIALDLSNTGRTAESLSELGYLENLVFLDISGNDLDNVPFAVYQLKNLQHLRMKNNKISQLKIPSEHSLAKLNSWNLSSNRLTSVDERIGGLENLTRLFLNDNKLSTLPESVGSLTNLKALWLNRNLFTEFPKIITKCTKLVQLHVAYNQIDSLPVSIYLLFELEVLKTNGNPNIAIPKRPRKIDEIAQFYYVDFSSAKDEVERIGEQEDEIIEEEREEIIYQLKADMFARALEDNVDTDDPGQLTFKKGDIIKNVKPQESGFWEGSIGSRTGYFPKSKVKEISPKDAIESRNQVVTAPKPSQDDTLLAGLQQQNKGEVLDNTPVDERDDFDFKVETKKTHGKAMIMKDIYTKETGAKLGIECWAIDDFQPVDATHILQEGLFSGDSYIVLHTHYGADIYGVTDKNKLDWTIHYWIGHESSTDKRACVAIHAVNLKAHLEGGFIKRHIEGDETPDFLKLVTGTTRTGSIYESSLKIVEEVQSSLKCYTLTSVGNRNIKAILTDEYDPPFSQTGVLLFDQGSLKHVWYGSRALPTLRNKARLFVDRINKNDYQGKARVKEIQQDFEPESFWDSICLDPPDYDIPYEVAIPENDTVIFYTVEINLPPSWETMKHRTTGRKYFLHRKGNGEIKKYDKLPMMTEREFQGGFLQLHQKEIPANSLKREFLDPDRVHLIDTHSMIYLWCGAKTEKMTRELSEDLKDVLANVFKRPEFFRAVRLRQFSENYLFKTLFTDWKEATGKVDFSGIYTGAREAKSELAADVNLRKLRAKKLWPAPIPPKCTIEYDVHSLFAYKRWLDNDHFDDLRADCNFECVSPDKFEQVFRVKDQKFIPLTDKKLPLYDTETLIYLVDYRIIQTETEKEQIERVAYVWQGRKAKLMDWLSFSHGAKELFTDLFFNPVRVENRGERSKMMKLLRSYVKSIAKYCPDEKENDIFARLGESIFLDDDFNEFRLVRIHQQREPERFLCHFSYRMIVMRGTPNSKPRKRFFKYGPQSNVITTRTMEVDISAKELNSNFCYFLSVPYKDATEDDDRQGVVYLWVGKHVTDRVWQDAYDQLFSLHPYGYAFRVAPEGNEHAEFWEELGGKQEYEVALYDHYCRLFRCSNSSGYFKVTEISTDFCQDDLVDRDFFIMDTQLQLFIWVGSSTSDVVAKLGLQAAKAYLRDKRRSTLEFKLVVPGQEPHAFTRYFQTWQPKKLSSS